jgi:hypothetical protein
VCIYKDSYNTSSDHVLGDDDEGPDGKRAFRSERVKENLKQSKFSKQEKVNKHISYSRKRLSDRVADNIIQIGTHEEHENNIYHFL